MHSKVKILKHPILKMQQYLTSKNENIKKEDRQNIFKMRCRMTKTKLNMKKMYSSYECRACLKESESDNHILTCSTILEIQKDNAVKRIPKYELIYNGNSNEQLEISRIFSANMKILENIKEEYSNSNLSTLWGPSDQKSLSESAVCTDTLYKLSWK